MSALPLVPLREAAVPVSRGIKPIAGESYRQLGVRLWGQGAYERELLDGNLTKYQQLFRAECGDIVVNKIWARNFKQKPPPSWMQCFPQFSTRRSKGNCNHARPA